MLVDLRTGRLLHHAASTVLQETFRLCQRYCDGVVLVDNAATSAAIKDIFTETRTILEPAGALGVAGAKAYLAREGMQVRPLHFCRVRGTTATHRLEAVYSRHLKCMIDHDDNGCFSCLWALRSCRDWYWISGGSWW